MHPKVFELRDWDWGKLKIRRLHETKDAFVG